jgi:ribose transport system substrate-binding protein
MDWIVGLDVEEAGQLVQSRITGAFESIRSRLPNIPVECYVRIDTRGMRDKSYKVTLDFLNRHPKDKYILIAANNDTVAMGAIEAIRELKREKHVAIVGQDCLEEMMTEMQRPGSPAIASISHEVGLYGPRLIEIGLALLRGETVPPYNYVEHRAITADRAFAYQAKAAELADVANAATPRAAVKKAKAAKVKQDT